MRDTHSGNADIICKFFWVILRIISAFPESVLRTHLRKKYKYHNLDFDNMVIV